MLRLNARAFAVLALIGAALFAAGCVSSPRPRSEISREADFGGRTLVCARPVFAEDVLYPEAPRMAFDENVYSGGLFFENGFVVNPEKGRRVEAAKLSFVDRDRIRSWAAAVLERRMEEAGLSPALSLAVPASGSIEFAVASETFRTDGKDDISIPIKARRAVSMKVEAMPESARAANACCVVPIIERVYAHGAGWFNGQDVGCAAGVRFSVIVACFDGATGVCLGQCRVEDGRILEDVYSLSDDAMLVRLEDLDARMGPELLAKVRQFLGSGAKPANR
jgi:hypothetical protein